MDIYIPFTYIIGWSEHKKFYYGAKYAQNCQPSDLWSTYFTSSKVVNKFRKEYGEPDIIKIHRTFTDSTSCLLFEHRYLSKIDARQNELFLNKSNGNKDFDTTGTLSVRDMDGNTFSVSVTDPKFLSGELVPISKGKITVKDKDGNTFQISNKDPRFLSGELKTINTGKITTKDVNGNVFFVDLTDPRYISGELVQHTKGTVVVKGVDGVCFRVPVDDERYVSGELKSVYTGFVNVKDNFGKTLKVSIDDPRYVSGELVHILKGVTPKKVDCPWCNKSVSVPLFNRWHGESCKNKPGNEFIVRSSPKKECPHCNKMVDAGNFTKYHGDNCKFR